MKLSRWMPPFCSIPLAAARRFQRSDPSNHDALCRFTPAVSSVGSSSSSNNNHSSRGVLATSVFNAVDVVVSAVVSSTDEATQLAEDMLLCAGASFEVEWRGRVPIALPLQVVAGTSIKITGSAAPTVNASTATATATAAVVDGEGNLASPLFYVNDSSSSLHLERVSLTGGGGGGGGGGRGGAVAAYGNGSVTLVDCAVYENVVSNAGGAIYLEESLLVADGTSFMGNSAESFGGAICACAGSTVSLQANITGNLFEGNFAKFGGAIYARDSSRVITSGSTSFVDNASRYHGGAIMVCKRSSVHLSGRTTFARNIAEHHGGVVHAEGRSFVRLGGYALFEENAAGNNGGAIHAGNKVKLKAFAEVDFIENTAELGGAIHAHNVLDALLEGNLRFTDNTAVGDGCALYIVNAMAFRSFGASFFENSALEGSGGALYFGGVLQLTVENATFAGNVAVWGGGVAALSSGTSASSSSIGDVSNISSDYGFTASWDPSIVTPTTSTGEPPSSPSSSSSLASSAPRVNFFGCQFEDNHAFEDGGGIYNVAEIDAIRSTTFIGNRAGFSGGALVHAGVMQDISGTIFEGNVAGSDGPVVLSLGIVRSMTDVTFKNNAFFCEVGTYGREVSIPLGDNDTCRFTVVCSRCAGSCGSDLEAGAEISNSSFVPSCEAAPGGTAMPTRGGTLDTLVVEPGFFRSSTASTDIRECFHEEACVGGVLPSEYCATGYMGPYCVVCAENYAPGYQYSCKSCVGESKRRAVAAMAVVMGVLLIGVLLLLAWLVSVVEPSLDAKNQPNKLTQHLVGAWQENALRKKFPLASVKIVVVMWQIITQFSDVSGVTYPWPYESFLNYIDVVNLDLGFIMSFACVYDTSFYDRMVIATVGPVIILAILGASYLVALRRNNHHSRNSSGVTSFYQTGFEPGLQQQQQQERQRRPKPSVVFPPFFSPRPQQQQQQQQQQRQQRRQGQPNASSEAVVTVIRNRHISVALLLVFVVYATVSHTVFAAFVCDTLDDGTSYLRADYSLECGTRLHTHYRIYAALMVALYPVGVPSALGWWLFRHREDLRGREERGEDGEEGVGSGGGGGGDNRRKNSRIRPAADLWGPYKGERYYFEVVECFRRLTLTGLAVFLTPDSSAQIAIVLLLATFFMVLSEVLSPFERPVEMWLYRAGHYVVFASMYLALLLRVDVSDERAKSQEAFAGILVTANGAMILVVVGQGLAIFAGREGEKLQESSAPNNDAAKISTSGGRKGGSRKRAPDKNGFDDDDNDGAGDALHYSNPMYSASKTCGKPQGRRGENNSTSKGGYRTGFLALSEGRGGRGFGREVVFAEGYKTENGLNVSQETADVVPEEHLASASSAASNEAEPVVPKLSKRWPPLNVQVQSGMMDDKRH